MRGKKKKKRPLRWLRIPWGHLPCDFWHRPHSSSSSFQLSKDFRHASVQSPLCLLLPLPGALSLTCSLTDMKSSPKCHLSARPRLTTLCISNILHCHQPHPHTLNLFPSSAYRHLLTFLSFFLTVPLLQLDYKICEGRAFYLFNFSWILNA